MFLHMYLSTINTFEEPGHLSHDSDYATDWTTGVRFPAAERRDSFTSLPRQDLLCGPPSLLSNG